MGRRSIDRRRLRARPRNLNALLAGRLRRPIGSCIGVVLLAMAVPVPRVTAATACGTLATFGLRSGTVTLAEVVPAGSFVPPATGRGRGGAPAPYGDLPAFCRVAATLRPTSDSAINIEVWMPVNASAKTEATAAAGWNGKLEALGGQGWAGAIGYAGLRDALRRGYAATATDSGHSGGTGTFALEHPEQLADFAYRSAHEMTLAARAIVTAFYGNGPRFSYWDGCSTGGRMALTEAQRFPDDFDGIIAGAPANFSSHQAAQMMSVALAVHPPSRDASAAAEASVDRSSPGGGRSADEASYIPPAKYALIHSAVIDACDAHDGVKDGVIEDPSTCKFDPKALECKGDDAPTCLTAPQVVAARKIYAPIVNPRTKQPIFPGLAPGSELAWGTVAGPQPLAFPQEIYKFIVFRNPAWDYRTLDLDVDVARAEQAYGGMMDAVNPDLKAYFAHGGKLLQYHGWSDQAVAPVNSINYYRSVVDRLGRATVERSYRLFMVPGMTHCVGGEGTSSFDSLGVLERWVEQGQAPAQIRASRITNGVVTRTRPLCPHPQIARYSGTGNTDEAESFVCTLP
jgi:feruloyl esterase